MSFPGLTRESRQKAMSSDWIPTFVGMTFELFTSRLNPLIKSLLFQLITNNSKSSLRFSGTYC